MSTTYTPDPRGYVPKYIVYRRNPDGSQGELIEDITFTLRPYDPHARKALLTYAESIKTENPILCNDLKDIVKNFEGK